MYHDFEQLLKSKNEFIGAFKVVGTILMAKGLNVIPG